MTNGDFVIWLLRSSLVSRESFRYRRSKGRSPLWIYGWPAIQRLTQTHPTVLGAVQAFAPSSSCWTLNQVPPASGAALRRFTLKRAQGDKPPSVFPLDLFSRKIIRRSRAHRQLSAKR